ncbi:MAG: acetyl-CoA carboxylase biotin carboxyl carrier protein [Lachnospiraceae bacterium]|nr:acetyl-CoA carboxylase biotin carboxyl carrier protein [Ruminococcus sp.]MCM1274167.1 acetyl-CoA carboxylase biotin carboxyl carrier protein [Lachnospiraceae bacterium]
MMNLKDKEIHQIEDTVECVEALARIVRENDLGRLKVSTEEIDIVIEGKRCPPLPPMGGMMPPPPMGMPPVGAPAPSAAPAAEKAAVSGNIITSPIIGTFYSSPAPEKPSFVKLGDNVNVGDVVCIIESMKLMNEINSEFSGRVAEIYVNNGDTVEYGQKLMRIE